MARPDPTRLHSTRSTSLDSTDLAPRACARGGADGGAPAEEPPACMACLEAEGRRGLGDGALPDASQIDAAVAACTAAGTACDGCLAPVRALAACALTALEEIRAMQGAMKIETEIEPDAEVPTDLPKEEL